MIRHDLDTSASGSFVTCIKIHSHILVTSLKHQAKRGRTGTTMETNILTQPVCALLWSPLDITVDFFGWQQSLLATLQVFPLQQSFHFQKTQILVSY